MYPTCPICGKEDAVCGPHIAAKIAEQLEGNVKLRVPKQYKTIGQPGYIGDVDVYDPDDDSAAQANVVVGTGDSEGEPGQVTDSTTGTVDNPDPVSGDVPRDPADDDADLKSVEKPSRNKSRQAPAEK